jgi:signal transduction histidine kinase
MWVSGGAGIAYYNPNKTKFNRFFSGFPVAISIDNNNNLYLGTSKGLWVINNKGKSERRILYNDKPASTQAHNLVMSINSTIPGFLLIGFESDLYEYNIIKHTFTKYPGRKGRFRIWDILVDREGLIWLAPMTEIVILDSEKNEIASIKHTEDPSSLTGGFVTVLLEDRSGVIWAGTTSGLNKIMVTRHVQGLVPSFNISHYKNIRNEPNSLSGNSITSMYEDMEGTLWIGTQSGLNKFDKNTDKFTRYTDSNGLPDNSVRGILQDNYGNLWVSTVKGLTRFNPVTEEFRNYGTADGLPNIFLRNSCLKSESGELYFGSESGIISFYPENIKENPHVPQVVITSFKVFNKEAALPKSILETEEISLSFRENFFSFEFSALDFTIPSKNQYAYMLEGIDKEWIKTTASKREANYTNIDPGEYVFRVKGSNNDRVWNEKAKSIKIIIIPPWWLTWWAKGFYVLIVVGFLGFVRHRKLSKIRSEMKQQSDFTKQLIESQEQERKRIAGELHDSLGQNLLMIKNKAILSLKEKGLNERTHESFNEISELTSLTLADVRAISYNLRPSELDRIGLTKTIEALIERVEKSTSLKFICELDELDGIFSPENEIIIYRILQECINNIIKHSGASEVQFVIKKTQSVVSIVIKDNGTGFEFKNAELKGGFGLKGISERVNLLKGNINTESKAGAGTRTTITLPVNT